MEYVYAALLLHKLGKPVDETGVTKVISSTGVNVDEGKVKLLVASLKDVDIDKELENATTISVAPATTIKEPVKEEKKEQASAAAEGLSSLFG